MPLEYTLADELADAGLYWKDDNGALINFGTGYTFSLKVYDSAGVAFFTKTTGITGAAGSLTTPTPNIAITWATTAELTTITTAGFYELRLIATRTADSKTRTFRGVIHILPTVT